MRLAPLVVASLLLTMPAAAQQPTQGAPADSAALSRMAGMFNQMGPMYETMVQAMFDGTLKALERPETVDRLARFARRYYEALMKEGFSKDEALAIVAGAGIPVAKATR